MLFNTVSYIAFLVLATTLFWLLPARARTSVLLLASLAFYGLWRVEFVALIVFSAFVDFFFSLRIKEATQNWSRCLYLMLSLSTNIALLIYFKYTYFIVDNLALIPAISGDTLRASVGSIILPLGISFYTFLSISYTIDVYRREFDPIRSFRLYLTYVMFWPHMIAGPILRAHELIPQLSSSARLNADDLAAGLRSIVFGLFLKVALADELAPLVDHAFAADAKMLGGLDVWTMAFAFGFQIYFDFAGYSMIAIGSARLLGIRFPDNFNWPYLAVSPRDFWRRWHITLSSWIRDYLYLPLSGLKNRSQSAGGIEVQFDSHPRNSARMTPALFATWFIMGLWHGASWSFAIWGLWHATFIFAYRLVGPRLPQLPRLVTIVGGWGITLAVVMLGWIPFRAHDLNATVELYGRLFDISSYGNLAFRENFYLFVFIILAGMLTLKPLMQWIAHPSFSFLRSAGEIAGVAIAIFAVFILLRPINQFIYFQF